VLTCFTLLSIQAIDAFLKWDGLCTSFRIKDIVISRSFNAYHELNSLSFYLQSLFVECYLCRSKASCCILFLLWNVVFTCSLCCFRLQIASIDLRGLNEVKRFWAVFTVLMKNL
jgi:hypothetical protein